MNQHIVVIGGGIAGTSAANTLTKLGYKVTIIEKNNYLGGRVRTHLVRGVAMEMGAGFLTKEYRNLLAFLDEAGLATGLYRQGGSSGILRNGTIRMATFSTLVGNSTLGWRTKLQCISLTVEALMKWGRLELHGPWKAALYDDRSVTQMFSKSSQKEFLEYFIQPVLNGYLYWSPEYTSRAAMLIIWRTAIAQGFRKLRLRGGLQRIPEKAAEGSKVLLGRTVKHVSQTKNGGYEVTVAEEGGTQRILADGIICATTASAVPAIFHDLNDKQRVFFSAMAYSSTALISQAYKREHAQASKGVAFPRTEGIDLSAVTLSLERSPQSAANAIPPVAKLNIYASGAVGEKLCKLSDDAITSHLFNAVVPVRSAFLVGNAVPLTTRVQRWPEALPFFDVGHLKRLRAFEEGKIEDPHRMIAFAGDYVSGPCMESAFTSGMDAAKRLNIRLRGKVQVLE